METHRRGDERHARYGGRIHGRAQRARVALRCGATEEEDDRWDPERRKGKKRVAGRQCILWSTAETRIMPEPKQKEEGSPLDEGEGSKNNSSGR